MARWTECFASALVVLSVAGCQSGIPKSARLRTSDDIRQSIGPTGLTSWGHDTRGNDFVSYTAPDGTIKEKSLTFADEGVWHIEPGGKICLQWHTIRGGVETCLTQYVNGGEIYNVLPDGSVASITTRQAPGNPEKL